MAKSLSDINWLSKDNDKMLKNWKVLKIKFICQCSANFHVTTSILHKYSSKILLHQVKTHHSQSGRPGSEDFVFDYIKWKKISE